MHKRSMSEASDEERESVMSSLGNVYCNERASVAYKSRELNSLDVEEAKKMRVIFRNQTPDTLVLCWSDYDGTLHKFYPLEPCTTIVSGVDGGELTTREDGVHMVRTYIMEPTIYIT